MALNFGVLDQGGPSNFFEGYSQGQEKMQANAMAQQKAGQAQQEFGMRQQEFAAGQADKRRAANTAIVTQKTLAGRDATLRAPTPDAARAIIRMQYSDPHLGPIRSQFGSLEQDLAEVPNDPAAFQKYKEQEAMGIEAFLKQQANSREFADIMGGGAAAPANTLAPTQPAWEPAPGAVPIQQGLTPGTSVTTFDGSGTSTNALAPAPAQAPAAAPTNALAPKSDVAAMKSKRDRLLAMGTTQSIAAAKALDADIKLASAPPVYHNVPGVGLVDPSTGRVVTPSVEKPAAPPSMVAEYTFAKTPEGGGYVGSFEKFVRDRAIAARPPGAPKPESAPVAVVDPITGKQVLVSRDEALRGRMTPAAAMESISPKEIQKREAALPQATSAVQGFESKSDKFVADLMALRNHPGLSSITGIAAGRMPGLTADGRAAQALYDKVVAKGGFQALQDLRDASKTGGALGNVSNQEGKQLTASFAAIDRRQDAPDVQAAIDQAIADIQGTKTRMREAYDSTYSYKSGGTPAPAASPGRPEAPARTQSGATTSNW